MHNSPSPPTNAGPTPPDDGGLVEAGLRAVGAVLDMVGSVLSEIGSTLLRAAERIPQVSEALGKARAKVVSSWWARLGIATAIGVSSPLTNGWGVAFLGAHEAAAWAPLIAIPIALGPAWFRMLAREAERYRSRRQAERPDPVVEEQLRLHAEQRKSEGQLLAGLHPKPPLEERDFAGKTLNHARALIAAASGQLDMPLAVVRQRKRDFEVTLTRGPADDDFRVGRVWSWSEVMESDRLFEQIAGRLDYRVVSFAFEIGDARYVLVGLAGSTIPDHARLRISEAATTLVTLMANAEGRKSTLKGTTP
jgi:hypothetical protein